MKLLLTVFGLAALSTAAFEGPNDTFHGFPPIETEAGTAAVSLRGFPAPVTSMAVANGVLVTEGDRRIGLHRPQKLSSGMPKAKFSMKPAARRLIPVSPASSSVRSFAATVGRR
jgi:hypothetical protein